MSFNLSSAIVSNSQNSHLPLNPPPPPHSPKKKKGEEGE
jgi:hypothetical protein